MESQTTLTKEKRLVTLGLALLGLDEKSINFYPTIVLQLGLDVINLAMNKTSAILQSLGFSYGQTEC